jgi:cytochrome c553
LSLFVLLAAFASAFLMAAQKLPDGPGKDIVVSKCDGCHGLDTTTTQKMDREGWESVVTRMVERGADLNDADQKTAVDYLAMHFGLEKKNQAGQAAADQTARRYLEGICASCHSTDLITTVRAAKPEWLEIVTSMNARGAGLSDADIDLLADYLAREYPAETR